MQGAEFLSAMIDPSAAQDFPAFKPSASPENPVYGQPQPPITSAPVAVTNVVSAKDVAEFPVAADVVPRAGNQSNTEGFTAEENSAGVAEGPTAVDAVPITPPAATSFTRKIRRSPAEGRNNNKVGALKVGADFFLSRTHAYLSQLLCCCCLLTKSLACWPV